MKLILMTLLGLCFFVLPKSQAQSFFQQNAICQQFSEVQSSSSDLVQHYQDLKPHALRILQEAISRTQNDIYQQMYQDLESAVIVDGAACDQWGVAYTCASSNVMNVCDHADSDYDTRTILHESVHMTGDMDECDADYYSAMAEIDSGEGLMAPGSYDGQCPNNPKY
jgi:hypothetical protein